MEITASLVKELRDKTGVGMMDCKKALIACCGDVGKSEDYLREKGLSAAANKASRIAAEGVVDSYIHMGGKIGVLVEVNCETDFVAKTPEFKSFVHDIALQIAASNPTYIHRDDVPVEILEKEKAVLRAQAINEGKPEKLADRMVEGRVEKFLKENCLLEQAFIRDADKSINDLLNEKVAAIGEKIAIRRFVRYTMGEGIEKKKDNFVEEVMKQTGN